MPASNVNRNLNPRAKQFAPAPSPDTVVLRNLTGVFQVAGSIGSKFKTNLMVPSLISHHAVSTIWIEYTNGGDVAISAPLLVVTATRFT